jgi:hypothetical protein
LARNLNEARPSNVSGSPRSRYGYLKSGAQSSAAAINGKDPVERIKRLMQLCRDKPTP